jgi:hypothetical protein
MVADVSEVLARPGALKRIGWAQTGQTGGSVAEHQRRVRVPRRLDDVAKSRELLNDLTYWLRKLKTHRENLLRQSRLDDAKSQRYARGNAA